MSISVEHILTRNLSEHLLTPVLLLDERGALIFFNEAAERIVGRPHDDLGEVGTRWPALLHLVDDGGRDAPPERVETLRVLGAREPARHDVRLRVAEGGTESFVVWTLPMIGREGEYLGSILSFWPG